MTKRNPILFFFIAHRLIAYNPTMSLHIIIDGYNLIRQSAFLSAFEQLDMQKGRERLLSLLSEYKKIKHYSITVVFDGANAPPSSPRTDHFVGIGVKFSQSGESADDVIKRMATEEREQALVVSSDQEVVNFAFAQGAATISSSMFEEKMALAAYIKTDAGDEDEDAGWTPTTKKRGPRRRLSKRLRRSKTKIQKL
ncbi:MAG: NYN domain-containing protein [Desulfobacterales bacterium]|nr:NYN domain-containing protein [Desulfobacterales bacterium]